jgi:hypothetical protein
MSNYQRRHEAREDSIAPGQRRHHALDAFETSGSSPPAGSEPRLSGSDELDKPAQHLVSLSLEPLVTTRQLAELWCQTPRWVLRMASDQGLPHYRLGGALRFRPSEAEAWLRQHRAGDIPAILSDDRPVELRSVIETRGAA